MNQEYKKVNGSIIVSSDKGTLSEIQDTPDADTRLKFENLNEGLLKLFLDKLSLAIEEKKTTLKQKKESYRITKSDLTPRAKYSPLLISLLYPLGTLFVACLFPWFKSEVDEWYNVLYAFQHYQAKTIGLLILGISIAGWTIYTGKKEYRESELQAVQLEEEITNLESELKKLETRKADLEQHLTSKETTEITPSDQVISLADYNRQLEESILARLRKINDLEEIRETLRELLQGAEIDSLLSPGTIMGTDVETIKETLEKRFLMQPTDNSKQN